MSKLSLGGIRFRLIEENDAEYVLSLRLDPRYNTHLSQVSGTVEAQREWIQRYKSDEAEKKQFYFIIERADGTRCGTVRLYDFQGPSFCWGSWILDENKTRYSAIASALLVYQFAFFDLGFVRCHFDVRKENHRVVSFHQRFGAAIVREDELNYYFDLSKEQFLDKRTELETLLQ